MEMSIEWIHTFTTIGTIITITVGSLWAFYIITSNRIDRIDTLISNINEHHRQDMRFMDEKFMKLDEKWERLFERLLIQDKKTKTK